MAWHKINDIIQSVTDFSLSVSGYFAVVRMEQGVLHLCKRVESVALNEKRPAEAGRYEQDLRNTQ
jgi:hypothetical protein